MSANIRSTRRLSQAIVAALYALVAAPSLAAGPAAPNLPQAVAAPIEALVLVGDDLGLLKVCKVAGPGIAIGTVFEFTAGKATINVPAGAAPDGVCAIGPMLPVGTTVTVSEIVPPGTIVAFITVTPPKQAASAPDLTAGSAMVQIGKGVTEVTFTNKRTGYLEICKTGEVKGDFRFVINPGSLGPYTVGAGACTPAIEVEAGSVVITEWQNDNTSMVGCSTFPANQQLACDLEGQTSTVTVGPGDAANQTVAFIENGPTTVTETGTIKVVKVVKNNSRANLSDLTYPITVDCDPGPGGLVLNLADGHSGTVDNVPLSADCKVAEIPPTAPEKGCPDGTAAQWTTQIAPTDYVHVGDTATVTNVLDCVKKVTETGTIKVVKVVKNNSRADLSRWTYPITVECNPEPATTGINLADGQSGAVDGVPLSAECKVSEILPTAPEKGCPKGTVAHWSSSTSPDGYVYAGDTVTVTNVLDCVKKVTETGTIKVTKVVKNNSRADLSDWKYPITLDCDPGPVGTQMDLADGQSTAVDKVPLSAECKVSEILPKPPKKGCPKGTVAQWSSTTSPDGYVYPGDSVTVTNVLDCVKKATDTGAVTVIKVVKNNSRADLSRWTYPITVECDPAPASTRMDLADGQSGAVSGVPLNAECKVSEILPTAPEKGCPTGTMAQWSSFAMPDGYVLAGETVTITNVLDCVKKAADAGTGADTGTGTSFESKSGTITVIKVVTNTSRADLTDWKYPITVECDSGPAETGMDLADGQSGVVDKVPFSAECKVNEAVPPVPDKVCPEGTVAQWSSISSPNGYIYAGDTVTVTNALDCVKKGG